MRSPGRIVDVVNDLAADVVAIQEIDRRMGPRPTALPRNLIEANTDLTPVPLATNDVSLGWHGNAILIRKGMKVRHTDRINLPGLEPRGAVLAEFESAAGALRVVGVHLGLVRRYRLRQLATIRRDLEARPDMATIVIGDFNEWTTDKGLAPFDQYLDVHSPGHSYHASRPVAGLDRIALSNQIGLRNAGVIETDQARVASDHLPIWADVYSHDISTKIETGVQQGSHQTDLTFRP